MLESLNFKIINSDQLLTFAKSVTHIFKNYPHGDAYTLFPFVRKAVNAYDNYSKAYERDLKNPYTIKLLNCDQLRDSAFLAFRGYVESWSHSEEREYQQAAARLLSIIEKHGWTANYMGYKDETAALTKITNEIKDFNMSDLELIEGVSRFNLMVARQAEFEEMVKSSASRPASLPTLIETRPLLVEALRKLLNMTDYHATENPEDANLNGYIKALNELITNTMTTARAAQTRNENRKKSTEGKSPAA